MEVGSQMTRIGHAYKYNSAPKSQASNRVEEEDCIDDQRYACGEVLVRHLFGSVRQLSNALTCLTPETSVAFSKGKEGPRQ